MKGEKRILAIKANSNKFKFSLGDYFRILTFIPNLGYDEIDWYSNEELHHIIKNVDFINTINDLKKYKPDKYNYTINLFENKKSNKNILYLLNLLNLKNNNKQQTKNLIEILKNFFEIKNIKYFYNKKKKYNIKYDIYIAWNTDEKWKIKRYPYTNFLELKSFLEKNYKLKVKIQSKNESLEEYIKNIQVSKLIISVVTLGAHIAKLFNKRLIVLAGPNLYNEIYDYEKIKVLLPDSECSYRPCLLPKGIDNCGCMHLISLEKLKQLTIYEYEKLSKDI